MVGCTHKKTRNQHVSNNSKNPLYQYRNCHLPQYKSPRLSSVDESVDDCDPFRFFDEGDERKHHACLQKSPFDFAHSSEDMTEERQPKRVKLCTAELEQRNKMLQKLQETGDFER